MQNKNMTTKSQYVLSFYRSSSEKQQHSPQIVLRKFSERKNRLQKGWKKCVFALGSH